MKAKAQVFREWALVELFGHAQIAGMVSEATIAGGNFVRVDVPGGGTRFFGPGAIYSISPVTEELARRMAASIEPPVQMWGLPRRLNRGDEDEEESR